MRYYIRHTRYRSLGISIIELLSTLIIMTVIALGISGTISSSIQASHNKDSFDSISHLVKSKLTDLSSLPQKELGSGTTPQEKWLKGAMHGEVISHTSPDPEIKAPHPYFLHFVLCYDQGKYSQQQQKGIDTSACQKQFTREIPPYLTCSAVSKDHIQINVVGAYLDAGKKCREIRYSKTIRKT
ncbi:MAG: hypothetical protein KDK51_11410 [Deltaproteobacteria bacterium]|nr:hypothetical protein [Deltaproteobacteria bacterium]